MSVIRTLSASETNEQREKERAKLEKEYKKSDARLDELVAEHATEIMEVMQVITILVPVASWLWIYLMISDQIKFILYNLCE